MKALWRVVAVVAAAFAAAAPALAQDTSAPPQQTQTIGPPQLSDFSLNGTVTQRPEPTPPQQARQQPPRSAARAAPEPATDSRERETSRPAAAPPRSAQASREPPPPPSIVADESSASAQPIPQDIALPSPDAEQASPPQADVVPPDSGSVPMLPWLVAALAFAGAAAWYVLRQRPRRGYAGAAGASPFDALIADDPAPAAEPEPAAPEIWSTGIVSTRLRPWLELQFIPQRGIVDGDKAAVAFQLSVFNSGNAPARAVRIEASMFNAGPMQDQQIRLFFDTPAASEESIAIVEPLQRVSLNSAVVLPREQLRPIEMEGRSLFVPMVAFNARYGWGGGEGQTSASFLVGKQTKGEKLAPFRLDLGPRVVRNLAAREHELRVRQ